MEDLKNIVGVGDLLVLQDSKGPVELDMVLRERKSLIPELYSAKDEKNYQTRPTELSSSPAYTDWAGDSD